MKLLSSKVFARKEGGKKKTGQVEHKEPCRLHYV